MVGLSRVTKLKEFILSENIADKLISELEANTGNTDTITVFISICNKKDRARVFHGSGKSLSAAWANAEKWLKDFQNKLIAKKKPFVCVWAKADMIIHYEELLTENLKNEINRTHLPYFFKKGIAFDDNFTTAYLECELNCNKMVNYKYDEEPLNLKNINYYRKLYYKQPELKDIPERIKLFTTAGYICCEDMSVLELHTGGPAHGRRIIDILDKPLAETIIDSSSKYLFNMIKPDGSYNYGIFPVYHNDYEGYNILRHTGSIWALINYYRITKNEELLPKLHLAIDYLLNDHIECKNDTAWIIEKKADEIKLGGNGLAIIMLTEYMDVFKTDKYIDTIKQLANGILELQDKKSGAYWHVLNYPDYTRKDEFRTIYYDGEATFALARAYTFTKDKKYLDGAALAVENFINRDYTQYRDHWVAYSVNEVVKYLPEPRYFEFALKNVENNIRTISGQQRATPTNLELLMAAWLTYRQYKESKLDIGYLNNFDMTQFAQLIYKRATHGLNSYNFPEFAMYLKKPGDVVDSFSIRDDSFRIRIDDIQHFIGGYYFYSIYFDELKPYLSEQFVESIEASLPVSQRGEFNVGYAPTKKRIAETLGEKIKRVKR